VATAISLLVQYPQLAGELELPVRLAGAAPDPGLALLLQLHRLAQAHPRLNTAALIERFRDSGDAKTLEKLTARDHLLNEDEVGPFFRETLATLEDQAVATAISELLDKAAADDLSEADKGQLAQLYQERAKLREDRENG
jgi:DNA primase